MSVLIFLSRLDINMKIKNLLLTLTMFFFSVSSFAVDSAVPTPSVTGASSTDTVKKPPRKVKKTSTKVKKAAPAEQKDSTAPTNAELSSDHNS